jgi:hypothetical protein
MRRTNIYFGAGALLVAAGAIGVGVMVSTNAMAAQGDPGNQPVTIGMVTVGSNGDAFECTFDAASVPGLIGPAVVGGGATVHVGATSAGANSAGAPPAGAVVVSASGSQSLPTDGTLPTAIPVPLGSGVITLQGTAAADGTSSVSQVGADGTVTPVKVRQGTAAECAAAQQGVPPSGAPQAPTVVSGNAPIDTAVDPKG